MDKLRAIMVCVDYADILSVTLPYNIHHFSEVMVVTTPEDHKTAEVVKQTERAYTYPTNAFYRNGAVFNKWLALEQALDCFGRRDWLCLMDADILWPRRLPDEWSMKKAEHLYRVGYLYSPLRRMWVPKKGEQVPSEDKWKEYPVHRNTGEWAGYTQIFHASDPHLGSPPWHETDWRHAGGADSFFQMKWPGSLKIRPFWEVLHIGEAGVNWCGRVTEYLDGSKPERQSDRINMMAAIWNGRRGKFGQSRYAHEKL